MNPAEVEAIVATTCSIWERCKRETVSIDAQIFIKIFPFLKIIHTIHDQGGNPYLILVNREDAIKKVTNHYGLKRGDQILEELRCPTST